MPDDPGDKPSISNYPRSDFRRLAAAERDRLNEPPPQGMCIGEWTALCTGKSDIWDLLAEQYERAIAEGRAWEFLYGDDKPPPPPP